MSKVEILPKEFELSAKKKELYMQPAGILRRKGIKTN